MPVPTSTPVPLSVLSTVLTFRQERPVVRPPTLQILLPNTSLPILPAVPTHSILSHYITTRLKQLRIPSPHLVTRPIVVFSLQRLTLLRCPTSDSVDLPSLPNLLDEVSPIVPLMTFRVNVVSTLVRQLGTRPLPTRHVPTILLPIDPTPSAT